MPSRKGDIGALRAETKTENATLRSQLAALRKAILTQMATCQLDIISKIAELDSRMTRLEP